MFNQQVSGLTSRCFALTFSLLRCLFGVLGVSLGDSGASIDCLRAAAQFGVGVSLGFGWRLFSVVVGVVVSSTHRVKGLGSDCEALTGGRQTVLWCRHRHETHPEMFPRVRPVCCHGNIFTNPGYTDGKTH